MAAGTLTTLTGVIAGIAVIAGTIAIVDALTTSYKEAREEWQASAQAYEDSTARVQSLEDELTDVSKKIDDINAKDKIDPTDREALDNLKKTKLNLEEQLELEKKLATYRQAKAAKDAKTAIDKGGSAAWDKESVFGIKGVEDIDYINAGVKIKGRSAQGLHLDRYDQISETSAVQNAIDRLIKERQDLEDNYRLYIDSMSESEQKANRDRVAKIDDIVTNLQEKAATNMAEIQEYLGSITDADGNALQGYEDYVFRIEQLQHQISGVEVDPLDDAIAHVKEFQQLAKDGNWDSAELRHYIGLLSGQDLSTADVEKVQEAWTALKQTIGDSDWNVFNFLKGDETNNLQQFWESVQSINSEWASFDQKTGEWTINITSVEALADELGLSEDLVNSIIKKTSEAGIDIDTTPVDNVRHAIMETSDALDVLKSKKVGIDFNLDSKTVQEAEQGIDHVAKYLASLRDDKGKLNLDSEEVQAAYTILSQLYDKKMELSNAEDITFRVNTEGISDDKIKTFITDVNNAKTAIQELQKGQKLKAQGFDIDVGELKKKAKEAVGKVQESFKELPEDKKVKLSITEEGVNSEHLGKTLKVLQQINEADCTVALGIDPALVEGYDPDDKDAEVKYSANYDAVTKSTPPTMRGKVEYRADYTNLSTPPGVGKGTASRTHFQGTANASGTWGSDHDGDDLVGELGRELRVNVRTGRWETIGDNGAEFTHIGKGDIIFNHKQTEQLLKYGHINSRGRALASGNAYDIGATGKGVLGSPKPKDNAKPDNNTGNHVKTAATNAAKSIKDAAKAVSDTASAVADESSKTADWVEKVLENLEKKAGKYISRAEKKAENGNYSGAARQYQKAQNAYASAMSKQKDASGVYASQANKILADAVANGTITKEQSASIQNKVAHGAMELEKLSDGVEKVVSSYQEYYNKAQDAAEATQELYDKYEELAEKMYQLPLDEAQAKTAKLEKEFNLLDKRIELTNSAAKRKNLIEKQEANLHKQLEAQMQAEAKAADNLRKARQKINEFDDKALKGLSDAQKRSLLEQINDNEKIDYTSLIGLTDEGRRAIIDYNAALEAQTSALYDAQMAIMDTTQQLKELALQKANTENEEADAAIDKRSGKRNVRNAQYEAAQTAAEKNALLSADDRGAIADKKTRKQALDQAEKDAQKAWDDAALQKFRNTPGGANKKFGEKITKAEVYAAMSEVELYDTKHNLLEQGSEEWKAAVDAIVDAARNYNAELKSLATAQENFAIQSANTDKTLQDNARTRIQNVADEWDRAISNTTNKIDQATQAEEHLGDVMNAMSGKSDAEKQALADKFAQTYGIQIDPNDSYYNNLAKIQGYKADLQGTLAQQYSDKADAVELILAEEKTKGFRDEGKEIEDQILADRMKGMQAESDKKQAEEQQDESVYNGSEAGEKKREAESDYEEATKNLDDITSKGGIITQEDYQRVVDTGTALQEIQKTDLSALQTQLEGLEPGTEKWQEVNDKIAEMKDNMQGVANATTDAKEAINDLGLQEFQDKLDEIAHNGAMIDARERKNDAIGNAIGGAMGVDGGSIGEALNAIFEITGLGIAGALGLATAIESGDTSLSGILSAVGSSMNEWSRVNTKGGQLKDEHDTLSGQRDYIQSVIDNPDTTDQQREDYSKQLLAVNEEIANNEAEQAEEANKSSGGGGSGGGGGGDMSELKSMLNNIVDWFANRIKRHLSKIEYQLKEINSRMELTEAYGRTVSADDLVEKIEKTKEEIRFYENEYIPMLKREVSYSHDEEGDPSGAERTQDYQALLQAESEKLDLIVELATLQRSGLRDKFLEPINEAIERLDRMRSILDGISGLITDDMLFDVDGQISKNGRQKLTLLIGEYQAAQAEVQGYINDINALNQSRANHLLTEKEYTELLADAQKKLLDAQQDREQAASEYVDILKRQSEEELDRLNEIIDARKEALQAKKDYYDYDKNIREKTKDIQTLEAQIAALNGLTDAESKAKRAQLEADLADAQEELRDTVQEHAFELAADTLDKLRDTLEEANEDRWKEVTGDLETLLNYVDDISNSIDGGQILDTTKEVLSAIGIVIDKIGGRDVDQTQFMQIFGAELKQTLDNRFSDSIVHSFNDTAERLAKIMYDKGLWGSKWQRFDTTSQAADVAAEMNRAGDDRGPDETGQVKIRNWDRIIQAIQALGPILQILFTIPKFVLGMFVGFNGPEIGSKTDNALSGFANFLESPIWNFSRAVGAWLGGASDSFNNDGYGLIGSSIQASKETSNMWQQIGEDIKNGWDKLTSGIKGLFSGHASGSKRIKRNEWAWTQEGRKEEWIVRQSDGAILTPLSKGDGVLPANLTSRLWDLATGNLPSVQPTMPSFSVPDMNVSENFSPRVTQTFGSLLTVNGNVDATVIDDLKQFTKDLASNKELLESAYKYTSEQMYRGFLHSGGKRRS